MRLLALACVAVIALTSLGRAEEAMPERRLVVTKDVDFYGADLQALFDTTYQACERACLSQPSCQAFTFNTRSNSCFPKSAVTAREPYSGAWSAEVIAASPEALALALTRAGDLAFLGAGTLTEARTLAAAIGGVHPSGQWTLDQMLAAADERRAMGDTMNAMRWMGSAVTQSDAGDHWVEYARLALEVAQLNRNERSKMQERALYGAINGYLRAGSDGLRVTALQQLADALERNGRGRDTVSALRVAEQIQPRQDITEALEAAIGKFGFRVVEHRVESNSATPRICAEFSEPLIKAGVDYGPFVKLPAAQISVEASDKTLCLGGVEHGVRYQVTLRAGLPAASGETLIKDVTLAMYVRDRAPSVTFPGRTYVLPKTDDAGLPVETVNLTDLELELFAVSDRNVVRSVREGLFGRGVDYWQRDMFRADIADAVWKGRATVGMEMNQEVLTRLPMRDALAGRAPGLYVLQARIPGADPYDAPEATQWFVLSDLGVATLKGTDGVHVFVRGLSDAAVRAGAKVRLISRSNAVLAETETDTAGHARFAAALTRGQTGAAPAMVMVENGGDDMTFLSLIDPAFDLSDRGVEGAEPAPPVDVFLTTDRGAYRAGDTIHATALARDSKAAALGGLPLTAVLLRPDGVEYSRALSVADLAGGHVFALSIGSTAPRGTYRLEMRAEADGAPLAQTKLLVEDFLPERLDFTLTLPDGPLALAAPAPVTLEARYLFGAPGADLAVEGEVLLREAKALPGWEGWSFGMADERFSPVLETISANVTDGAGKVDLLIDHPDAGRVDRPLEAEYRLRVAEGSGRPVERRITRSLAPDSPVIGIKALFDGDGVSENSDARFQIVALGTDLTPIAMPVQWTLNRVETRYQWYQSYGSWNWEPVTRRSAVKRGTAQLGAAPVEVSGPVEWGRYELVVERTEGNFVASSHQFYAGWFAPADTASTPDTLELTLDKPRYRPGEEAVLRLVPRYAGTAVVQVMSNHLIAMVTAEVTEGETLLRLPVTEEWGTGAYVTATVIRPMEVSAGRNPARALGLAHAAIDPGAKALGVTIDAPAEASPRGKLVASVKVAGVTPGEVAYVTVAAVDLGILNLTGFQSPNPARHYFGQRRLGMEMRDLYGRLIYGMNGAAGQVRSGGDASAQMRLESPPPTEELLATFSGPIEVDAEGRAELAVDLPAFNGTVRLMAVAWSPTGVGQAEADVLVRDPVVVTASLPRFLAPGDAARLLLEIVHATGPAGRMGLDVSATGVALDATAVPSGVDLAEKGKAVFSVPLRAGEAGDATLRVALTTPDGRQLVKEVRLGVRANDHDVARTQRFDLAAGATFTLDDAVFDGLPSGTGEAVLTAGPLARFNAPALLRALDRYPYGCTEQVTSQAMPLLAFGDVAQALGMGGQAQISLRVDQAVERVLSRQASNGGFGLWRADSGDLWLDAYVTDFLSRARAKGHAVPDLAFRQAMDNLRNQVNYAADFDKGGQDLAYALMILAREGAAAMGDLRYYVDVKGDAFNSPLAAAQLATALAQYGDQTRADAMFARAARMIAPAMRDESAQVLRADYGSNLRDAAGVLALAVAAGTQVVNRDVLAERLSNVGRALSTQESAWSLMAAQAMVADPGLSGITFDGVAEPLPLARRSAAELGAALAVKNTRSAPVEITLTTSGVPEGPVAEGGYGYRLTREYFTPDGTPVADLSAVAQGARLVVVLTAMPFEQGGARLMFNDPLPAGFEIDNPTLMASADVAGFDWLTTARAEMAEFRADRFLAAVNQDGVDKVQLAYTVRAISPGVYHHPAAVVEDMYRPQYRANTASGQLVVMQ